MKFETLLPCPFCGGEPEEDAGGCNEYHGHEHQDYSITCKQCGAEVYCSVGTFEKADVPCSCHHDTRKVCVDKWNKRAAMLQAGNSPVIGIDPASGPDRTVEVRYIAPPGYVMVPRVPSQAHLNSIAMRYRHNFYLLNDAQKDSALATARQMYEECSGQGFYTLPAAPQEVKGE